MFKNLPYIENYYRKKIYIYIDIYHSKRDTK